MHLVLCVRGIHFPKPLMSLPIQKTKFSRMAMRPVVSASLVSRNTTEILCKTVNRTRMITLNKPSSLNAFNHNMAVQMHQELQSASSDDSIQCILIKGGDKSFCVGGDVRELMETSRQCASTPNSGTHFLRDEYSVMLSLQQSLKPVIALAHGYAMGAGCSMAVNSLYTVVTEDAIMSMPETAIGYYPDNGGSHFLSRLDGHFGTYLGLTGRQLKGQEAYFSGLATHYVTHQDGSLQELETELLNDANLSHDRVQHILRFYHQKCSMKTESQSSPHKPTIDSIFQLDTMEDIIRALTEDNSTWSLQTLRDLSSKIAACFGLRLTDGMSPSERPFSFYKLFNLKAIYAVLNYSESPYALKLTLRMLREAASLTFAECLSMELKLGQHLLSNPNSDCFRGVQAVLVDKTEPAWNPSRLEDIDDQLLDRDFEDLINSTELDIKAKL